MDRQNPDKDFLFRAILSLETVEECYEFFEDVCTVKEVDEMAKRIRVASLLISGKAYSEIVGESGAAGSAVASTATISRVNRCVKYGGGGYRKILSRLADEGVELPEADR